MWLHDLVMLAGAVLPVFLVIALGFALRRNRFLSSSGAGELAKLAYWVALPCQLFILAAAADLRQIFDLRSALAGLGGFVGGMIVVLLSSPRLPSAERGSLATGMCRANAAFVGLPVIYLVARALPPEQGDHLEAAFTVLIPIMVSAFNIGSTIGFLVPQHGVTRQGLTKVFVELPRNPLIIASVAGILVSLLSAGRGAGGAFGDVLVLIGLAASPMALLATGAELDFALMRARPGLLVVACVAKLALLPGLTWLIGWLIGADPLALTAAVVLMACPTAIAAGPMARQLGGDEALMAAIIATTTVFSPVTLVLWLVLLT